MEYGRDRWTTLLESGREYHIFLPHAEKDYIQKRIREEQQPYEKPLLQALAAFLKEGDLFIDVGANIGNHTLYLSCVLQCKVEAFEPNHALVDALRLSVEQNSVHDLVKVHSIALGQCQTVAEFEAEVPENMGAQRLVTGRGELVVKPLDSFVFDQRIKAIKIDVEGMELDVLKGAESLIRSDRPMLVVEVGNLQAFESLVALLEGWNYQVTSRYNATPTFLFFPEERLTDKHVAALLEHQARREFQHDQTLQEVRSRLDAANQKYRSSSVQIASLKQALEQHKAVQALAKEQAQSVRELEKEREALTASKERTAAELQLLKEKLDAANQKYRQSNEQVASLKAELSEATAKLAATENEHFETLAFVQELEQTLRARQVEVFQLGTEKRVLSQLHQEADEQRSQALIELNTLRSGLAYRLGRILASFSESPRHWPESLKRFRRWLVDYANLRKQLKLERLSNANEAKRVAQPSLSGAETVEQGHGLLDEMLEASASGPVASLQQYESREAEKWRVACILDDFSFQSFEHEADFTQISPDSWASDLESCNPELVFIESAWRGKDDLWGSKVVHKSSELQGIIAWCRARGIPTAFWNKEDPVHFSTFLNTALLFDYVFTTDIDCIQKYKAELGHDRVHLLPFACQPLKHNPIETYTRKDAFCFAGAYYVRYPERTRDLEHFLESLSSYKHFDIFDRNHGSKDTNYIFPEEYRPFIVGKLPFDQIDKAYKGYRYAINLNSVKQSQTMFARRVFELLACNTLTISNFSRGIRHFFGDLVFCSDDGAELRKRLEVCESDPDGPEAVRLAALRKVMREHTYADRWTWLISRMGAKRQMDAWMPQVAVLAHANDTRAAQCILEQFMQQSWSCRQLWLLVPDSIIEEVALMSQECSNVNILSTETHLDWEPIRRCAQWVAPWHTADYHGPHWMEDLMLATRYAPSARVLGKDVFFASEDGTTVTRSSGGKSYLFCSKLLKRSAILHCSVLDTETPLEYLNDLDEAVVQHESMFSADRFSFCLGGAGIDDAARARIDGTLRHLQQGQELKTMLERSLEIQPQPRILEESSSHWSGEQLASYFKSPSDKAYSCKVEDGRWKFTSSLEDGRHEYLYASEDLPLEPLSSQGFLRFHLESSPGLNLQFVVIFLDLMGKRVSHVVKAANHNHKVAIPPGAFNARIGIRVYAGGTAVIESLHWGFFEKQKATVQGLQRYLLVTNQYPSYENLYRNGFVHSRVRAYRERGVHVDIFRFCAEGNPVFREFEGVDIVEGDAECLNRMLDTGCYRHILVHFLLPDMWKVLRGHVNSIPVTVWMHGFEAHAWHRRTYNYATEEELEEAKSKSAERMAFWENLFNNLPEKLHLVFVSKSFFKEVLDDVGVEIPATSYSIIHNPIDTGLFSYQPKSPEQRKRILSIRPFMSRQYANDLTVKTILQLASEPWFGELDFRIIGDGPLFDHTLEPLRKLPNVCIERGFLKQYQIADLHKQYGLFLCPTRWDSHGVSRDEAMASGLVPLTNRVAAIPEFVDDDCGILADAEDVEALAAGIRRCYQDESHFQRLSENATKKVTSTRSTEIVIARELSCFVQS